ncbi:MAG: hypothetical protein IPL39_05095 [Opitutaceae bacterium]|nr:hypothetical protein [Opitutaceae bacterium]
MRGPSRTQVVLVAVLAAAVFTSWQVALGPRSLLLGFSWTQAHHFESLRIGASKSSVIDKLGLPLRTSSTCNLPQRQGFEEAFGRAKTSGAARFLLWYNGGNWYYCGGFDVHDRLVFVGEGHS